MTQYIYKNSTLSLDVRVNSLIALLTLDEKISLLPTRQAAIKRLKSELNLHCDLKEFHLTNQQIRELAIQSMHPNMKNNPTEITQDMLVDMYRSLC